MTLEELYKFLGGDYDEVMSRLSDQNMIKKLLIMFPDDPSYSNLCIALKYGDMKGAHLAAESLLGTCKNLGFLTLAKCLSDVAEAIKKGPGNVGDWMMSVLGSEYESTVYLVKKYTGKS